jgi:hypothetical protein
LLIGEGRPPRIASLRGLPSPRRHGWCCGSRGGKLWAAAKEDPATASSVGAWVAPPCSVGQGKGKTRVAVNLVGNGSD